MIVGGRPPKLKFIDGLLAKLKFIDGLLALPKRKTCCLSHVSV